MERPTNLAQIATLFRSHPAVTILGPRQCGKTTLAQDYLAAHAEGPVHYFDLEDPAPCTLGRRTSASGR